MLDLKNHPGFEGHKAIHIFYDQDTELSVIVAIHNDDLGPALGGARLWPYACFEDALTDVLRLSSGMTRKAAMAGLNYGGGKAVIICHPEHKTPGLIQAFARKINRLNGQFITGEDVNITVADIEKMAEVTPYVVGRSPVAGGGDDPSVMTAFGVFRGIQACLTFLHGNGGVAGRTVAIQGVGKVGFRLARLLYQNGAKLIVSDINSHMVERAVTEFKGAATVSPEEIYDQECDVFSPCALGGSLNVDTIPKLKCSIVAGAANNQLESPSDGHMLAGRNIVYAVDYVINAGGLINVTDERQPGGYNRARAERTTDKIYWRVLNIIRRAKSEDVPAHEVAESMVNEILESACRLKQVQRKFNLA